MRHWLICAAFMGPSLPSWAQGPVTFGVDHFNLIEKRSGPVNYYSKVRGEESYIRAEYRPPFETAVMGVEIPKFVRRTPSRLSWKWRAMKLPVGGDECRDGKGDSAAVVYVMWKRGLKWYTLKYVWSSQSPSGAVCDTKRNIFVAQDTVVLRSGGPTGSWMTETIDPTAEFRKHFRDGDPNGDVPDLVGIGIMSDGDQTRSESAADYAEFVLSP